MKWRKDFDVDNLDQWERPEVLRKYVPGGHIGFDKEGAPIWLDLAPQMDWRGTGAFLKRLKSACFAVVPA